MILSFKTVINGKPNYFIEKIWTCLKNEGLPFVTQIQYLSYLDLYDKTFNDDHTRRKGWDGRVNWLDKVPEDLKPKLHTIREDKKDRWKSGDKIHPVIKPKGRFSAGFQFAPTFPCVSTQTINIYHPMFEDKTPGIKVDGKVLSLEHEKELAVNDGFENLEDFYKYFDKTETYKIIHFTNLRY